MSNRAIAIFIFGAFALCGCNFSFNASGPVNNQSQNQRVPASVIPPPGADEPAFDASNNTMIYQDNMDSYTTTPAITTAYRANPAGYLGVVTSAAMSGYPEDANTSIISNGRSGKALRETYSGAYQESHNLGIYASPYGETSITDPTKPVYIQYWFRFIWASPPASNASLAVKWVEIWHPPSSTGNSQRVQFSTRYSSYNYYYTASNPDPGNRPNTVWQVIEATETTHCGEQAIAKPGLNLNDIGLDGGIWHRVTYAYLPNSYQGARDGYARMWLDGVKLVDVSQATVGVVPPLSDGGLNHPWCYQDDVDNLQYGTYGAVQSISFAGPQTTVTPGWTLDWDDFQIWQ